jgi:hypothetical protein
MVKVVLTLVVMMIPAPVVLNLVAAQNFLQISARIQVQLVAVATMRTVTLGKDTAVLHLEMKVYIQIPTITGLLHTNDSYRLPSTKMALHIPSYAMSLLQALILV